VKQPLDFTRKISSATVHLSRVGWIGEPVTAVEVKAEFKQKIKEIVCIKISSGGKGQKKDETFSF